MTRYKPKMLLSLLLALVCVVTMLPMTALAADDTELTETPIEEACTDENCAHEHEQAEDTAISEIYEVQSDTEIEEIIEPVSPESALATESQEITEDTADSGLAWDFDADCGELFIYGSGAPETFSSADDQPWAAIRERIVAVHIDDCDGLTVGSIAYWFSSCVNLEYAEIASGIAEVGYHAFYDCQALKEVVFLHESSFPEIVQGAFETHHPLNWATDYDPRLHIAVFEDWMLDEICAYNWGADDCPLTADVGGSVSTVSTFALSTMAVASASSVGYCSSCGGTYSYTLAYEQWTDSVHCIRHWCSNCGYDQCGGVNSGSHSYSHYNSSYDRCTYCGYLTACTCAPACTHSSYTTTWVTSCQWERYCSSCGAYLSSGTSHGPYTYGSWAYYSASQHRRSYTCSYGDSGTYYEYGSHSLTTQYGQYSATQHSVRSYCATCGSYVGSTSYANHSFTYGAWSNYSATQHRRLKTCSVCGYNEYEYANHTLSYGNWTPISDTQHQRTITCAGCSYSATDSGAHADTNNDGYCDDCGYSMTHFSVTVPVSLTMTVSKYGEVYTSDTAVIVNNSTGAVEVTAVTVSAENGWTLVPYHTDMAEAKVDTKLIGFSMNGAQSSSTGDSETLSLSGAWSIPSGNSLPLVYDAVVSAISEAVNEQVLTVVFVLDWA